MKKKIIKFSFCFVCLPFFLISCASKPEMQVEPSNEANIEIAAPVVDEDTALEESLEAENQDAEGSEEDKSSDSITDEEKSSEDNEIESEDSETAEAEDEVSEAAEADSENEEIEQTEEDSNQIEQSENPLEEIEEPEVITVEYEEAEKPVEETAEEIASEELDLDYIDVISDDEDDEIKPSSTEIEVETEENAESFETNSEDENSELDKDEEIIEASRKVTMKLLEYIDITYPGNGWFYMGLTDGSKDMTYYGRKLGTKDTKFTLQAKNAGLKYVHFYRVDPLTNEYIDDFIEITVLSEKGSNKTHITAPDYTPPLPKKAKSLIIQSQEEPKADAEANIEKNNQEDVKTYTEDNKSAEAQKATENNNNQIENTAEENVTNQTENEKIDVNSLLKEAELLYNNKEYSSADKKIKTFLDYALTDRDYGLFLQGQILEAKSEIQDIKSAIEAYKTLTKNYPASPYWDKANKQIIYLSRFYLEIR